MVGRRRRQRRRRGGDYSRSRASRYRYSYCSGRGRGCGAQLGLLQTLREQIRVHPRLSDHSMTLPTRCCSLSIDISAAGSQAAARRLCLMAIDRPDRQTDGQTDGHRTVTQTLTAHCSVKKNAPTAPLSFRIVKASFTRFT